MTRVQAPNPSCRVCKGLWIRRLGNFTGNLGQTSLERRHVELKGVMPPRAPLPLKSRKRKSCIPQCHIVFLGTLLSSTSNVFLNHHHPGLLFHGTPRRLFVDYQLSPRPRSLHQTPHGHSFGLQSLPSRRIPLHSHHDCYFGPFPAMVDCSDRPRFPHRAQQCPALHEPLLCAFGGD